MSMRVIVKIYTVQLERKTDPNSSSEICPREDLNILVCFSQLFIKG